MPAVVNNIISDDKFNLRLYTQIHDQWRRYFYYSGIQMD